MLGWPIVGRNANGGLNFAEIIPPEYDIMPRKGTTSTGISKNMDFQARKRNPVVAVFCRNFSAGFSPKIPPELCGARNSAIKRMWSTRIPLDTRRVHGRVELSRKKYNSVVWISVADPVPVLPDPVPVLPDPVLVLPDPVPVLPDPIPVLPDPVPVLPDPVPVLPDPNSI